MRVDRRHGGVRPAENLAGFTVIDPGGNWIRIYPASPQDKADETDKAGGPLASALANAVVLADSKGDTAQAAKILDGALRKATDAPAAERVEALAYLVELMATLGEPDRMHAELERLRAVDLTDVADADRDRVTTALAAADELAAEQR